MKNHHHNGPIHPTSKSALIHESIATRAYELWDRDGRPADQADAFWLAAEQEQMAGEQAPKRKKPKPEAALPVSF